MTWMKMNSSFLQYVSVVDLYHAVCRFAQAADCAAKSAMSAVVPETSM